MYEGTKATRKQNKKTSLKKKQKASTEAITYEVIHKNYGYSFGTIKLIDNKFKSSEEYSNFVQKYNLDPDFLPQSHLSLEGSDEGFRR